MRILYIGNTNLSNDIISKVVSTKDGYEVHLLTPEELEQQQFAYDEPPYEVAIIDLNSSLDGKINYVKQINSKNISRKRIILYSDSSEVEPEQLLEAGADQILAIDKIESKDLLQSIDKLDDS